MFSLRTQLARGKVSTPAVIKTALVLLILIAMRAVYSLGAALLPPTLLAAAASAAASPSTPTVTLPNARATVVGSSASGIDTFLGIPFAQPPVGPLRLAPPRPLTAKLGLVNATTTPQACPQFESQTVVTDVVGGHPELSYGYEPVAIDVTSSPEDCLTVNVQRPAGTTASSKLPVVFWIYGGGFEFGSTQANNAANLIGTSVSNGHPILYVAVNYRLGGFGFLGGKEILAAGAANLGLLDQRLGLQWVADNIAAFGGDPSKVTIWGESAGAISVFDQMALYGGNYTYKSKKLFRAAVMNSGSIVPTNPVNGTKAQAIYDTVVRNANCSKAANTLSCLRSADFNTFYQAANSVPAILGYNSVALSYLPRPDGKVLTDSPEVVAQAGKYAAVPFIVGDQQDEGTVFSTAQKNVTSTALLVEYLHQIFFPDYPQSLIARLVATYPDSAPAGSPFMTGQAYEIYPEYKRLSALLGDITFTLSRRAFLAITRAVFPGVKSYSYLATYYQNASSLGTYHSSDLPIVYGQNAGFPSRSIQAYYLSFFNTMDPNAQIPANMTKWPLWGTHPNGQLLNFSKETNGLLVDDFRNNTYTFLVNPNNSIRI